MQGLHSRAVVYREQAAHLRQQACDSQHSEMQRIDLLIKAQYLEVLAVAEDGDRRPNDWRRGERFPPFD
jgi:hypothetical protein